MHQVFQDVLDYGFFTMARVNLLILDECHHAIGNHAYKQIMKRYAERKEHGDPGCDSKDIFSHPRICPRTCPKLCLKL